VDAVLKLNTDIICNLYGSLHFVYDFGSFLQILTLTCFSYNALGLWVSE
jgi:hypothetical protein